MKSERKNPIIIKNIPSKIFSPIVGLDALELGLL
jgi:hypothetical protein